VVFGWKPRSWRWICFWCGGGCGGEKVPFSLLLLPGVCLNVTALKTIQPCIGIVEVRITLCRGWLLAENEGEKRKNEEMVVSSLY